MADYPIIFSAPMVEALLAGRKTQTRRVLYRKAKMDNIGKGGPVMDQRYPPGTVRRGLGPYPTDIAIGEAWTLGSWHKLKPGDRLWVKESWTHDAPDNEAARASYEDMMGGAYHVYHRVGEIAPETLSWKGPRFMPRWASRITLKVSAVKIERARSISDKDALAEGVVEDDGSEPDIFYVPGAGLPHAGKASTVYQYLWQSLHGFDSWQDNPWVVAPTFTVEKKNINAIAA